MKSSYSFSFSQDWQKMTGKKNLSPLIMASASSGREKKPLALTEEKILNVFREQKISGINFNDTNLTCQSQA